MLRIFFKSLFLVLIIIAGNLSAQTPTAGKVEIIQSEEIDKLVKKHIALSDQRKTTEGYRVQIHFGGERAKAQDIKAKFLKQFPEVGAYESYQQPNFRVRVGDFRTKIEAQKLLKDIAPYFPSAFVVADEIQWPAIE